MDLKGVVDNLIKATIYKERVEHDVKALEARMGEENKPSDSFKAYLEETKQRREATVLLYNKTRETYKYILSITPDYEIELVKESLGYRLKAVDEECLLYNRKIDETNFRSLTDASIEEVGTNDEIVAYAKERLIEKIEEKRQVRSCIYYLEEELKRRHQKQM